MRRPLKTFVDAVRESPKLFFWRDSLTPSEKDELANADWEELTKRLLRFADWRLKRRWWRGAQNELPAGAPSASDYVQDAVLRTLSGQRRYDASRGDLFSYLCGVID